MRGVENNEVNARLDQSGDSVENVNGRADCRAAEESALVVTRGAGILHALLDILNGDQALETAVSADNRELFDFMLTENLLRLLERRTDGSGNQIFLRHDRGDRLCEIRRCHKAHVAVGDNTNQLTVAADGNTRNLVLAHQIIRVLDGIFGRKEERVDNNAVFTSLYAVDHVRLSCNLHVLVDHADAALTCDRDRHSGLGNGIHRRGHQGGIETNRLGEVGGNINALRLYV